MKQIMEKLEKIESEVGFIKDHMFDPDTIMTLEEEGRYKKALQELKAGKTTPLSKLKKELGL